MRPGSCGGNPKAETGKTPSETVLGLVQVGNGELAYFQTARKLGETLDRYEKVMREGGLQRRGHPATTGPTAFAFCKGDRRHFELLRHEGVRDGLPGRVGDPCRSRERATARPAAGC